MEITKDEDQDDEFEIPEKMYFINNFVIKITWAEHGQVNTGGDVHESGDHLIYFGRLVKSYGHGMVTLFFIIPSLNSLSLFIYRIQIYGYNRRYIVYVE